VNRQSRRTNTAFARHEQATRPKTISSMTDRRAPRLYYYPQTLTSFYSDPTNQVPQA
jgi:hypothetical protein